MVTARPAAGEGRRSARYPAANRWVPCRRPPVTKARPRIEHMARMDPTRALWTTTTSPARRAKMAKNNSGKLPKPPGEGRWRRVQSDPKGGLRSGRPPQRARPERPQTPRMARPVQRPHGPLPRWQRSSSGHLKRRGRRCGTAPLAVEANNFTERRLTGWPSLRRTRPPELVRWGCLESRWSDPNGRSTCDQFLFIQRWPTRTLL